MPFVDAAHRKNPDPNIVGDLCYVHYKRMMEEWTRNPRWTTAHKIYKNIRNNVYSMIVEDNIIAQELAWQVFFQLHVMPYERKKEAENGPIE